MPNATTDKHRWAKRLPGHRWAKRLLGGILIGCANVVPGVSGGTVAVTLGLYRQIVEALSIRAMITSFRRVAPFLITLGAGAAIGILGLARVMAIVLERLPILGVSFFIGLIVGGVPYIFRRYRAYPFRLYDGLIFAAGVAVALIPKFLNIEAGGVGAQGVSAAGNEVSTGLLVVSGFAAAVAMVLPGISGSLLLLVLGSYSYILNAVNSVDIPVLTIFAISVAAGILCCARGMREVFSRWPRQTWIAILGLVVGSVVILWPPLPRGLTSITGAVGAFVLGVIPSYMLASAK